MEAHANVQQLGNTMKNNMNNNNNRVRLLFACFLGVGVYVALSIQLPPQYAMPHRSPGT